MALLWVRAAPSPFPWIWCWYSRKLGKILLLTSVGIASTRTWGEPGLSISGTPVRSLAPLQDPWHRSEIPGIAVKAIEGEERALMGWVKSLSPAPGLSEHGDEILGSRLRDGVTGRCLL